MSRVEACQDVNIPSGMHWKWVRDLPLLIGKKEQYQGEKYSSWNSFHSDSTQAGNVELHIRESRAGHGKLLKFRRHFDRRPSAPSIMRQGGLSMLRAYTFYSFYFRANVLSVVRSLVSLLRSVFVTFHHDRN